MVHAFGHFLIFHTRWFAGGQGLMLTSTIMLVAGCIVMATSIFTAARPLRMVSPY